MDASLERRKKPRSTPNLVELAGTTLAACAGRPLRGNSHSLARKACYGALRFSSYLSFLQVVLDASFTVKLWRHSVKRNRQTLVLALAGSGGYLNAGCAGVTLLSLRSKKVTPATALAPIQRSRICASQTERHNELAMSVMRPAVLMTVERIAWKYARSVPWRGFPSREVEGCPMWTVKSVLDDSCVAPRKSTASVPCRGFSPRG